jgi:hypothetical protein
MNSKLNGQKSRSIATQKVLMRAAEKLIAKNGIHNISSLANQTLTTLNRKTAQQTSFCIKANQDTFEIRVKCGLNFLSSDNVHFRFLLRGFLKR